MVGQRFIRKNCEEVVMIQILLSDWVINCWLNLQLCAKQHLRLSIVLEASSKKLRKRSTQAVQDTNKCFLRMQLLATN